MSRIHHFLLPALAAITLCTTPALAQAREAPKWMQALAPALSGVVNINEATEAQLALLPGIGPATAAKIIEYRERRPFRRLTHLLRIKGIGKKTFARIQPYLTLEGPTTLHELVEQPAARP